MLCFAVVAIYRIHTCIQLLYLSPIPVSWACLVYSDYKGWTCLHHAASAGYTQTMDILLSANLKLLDKTDEDGVWITIISKSSTQSKSVRNFTPICVDKFETIGLFLQFVNSYVKNILHIFTCFLNIAALITTSSMEYNSPVMYWYTRTLRSTSQRERDMWLQSGSCWLGEQSSS